MAEDPLRDYFAAADSDGAGPNEALAALASARVDLVELIRAGIPERDYVPGCEGWGIKGKRYLVYADSGAGKSLAWLVIGVEIVARGGTVAIIDVENGGEEYARRLECILSERDDGLELAAACSERLQYHEYPRLRLTWTEDDWAAALERADVVVFDSSRLTLSSVGLSEDSNDDYAQFMQALIMPLSRSGKTTVILDNSGHEGGHARGASSKRDLNEVQVEMQVIKPFSPAETGEVVWRRDRTRFPEIPRAMRQRLGGGVYETPREVAETETASGRFRPTVLMERVSTFVESHPGESQNVIEAAVTGKAKAKRLALDVLVEEGYIVRDDVGRGTTHRSVVPYREADDERASEADDERASE
jgi:hypothetical protein